MRPTRKRLAIESLEGRLVPAVFNIPYGNTAALVAAINTANTNNQPDTIELANSRYDFAAAADPADGGSALPTIRRDGSDVNTLTIHGNGATLERSPYGPLPAFRILRIGEGSDAVAVTISDLGLAGKAGNDRGGAILLLAGDLTLTNCHVGSSYADTGGAIYATATGPTQRHLTIVDSSLGYTGALGSNGGGAGGVIALDGNIALNVVRTRFHDSVSATDGGAIAALSPAVTISIADSDLVKNTAYLGGNGGAIFSRGPVTITNSTVADNDSTAGGGGGVYVEGGGLTLTGSTVSGNHAEGDAAAGGGVYCDGPLTVVNSTVDGNRAANGGGVALAGASATSITHSTVTANRAFAAAAAGGGVWVGGSGTLTLGHTIVAGNTFEATVTSGTGPDLAGPAGSLGYNLIENTSGTVLTGNATGNITGVPAGLGPLQWNGGRNATRLPLANGPARDAGDPSYAGPLSVDAVGRPRVLNGRIDLGAAEAPPPIPVVAVNDGSVQRSEVRSLSVTFSEPVTFANNNPAAAFTLTRVTGAGGTVGMNAAVSTNGFGQTVVTLTFTGATITDPMSATNGGLLSLADGRYRLDIAAAAVTGAGGQALDGDGNGVAGGDYHSPTDTWGGGPGQVRLFRLFGDYDGNGVVDLVDLASFRAVWNSSTPSAASRAAFDADNNGVVDLIDLAELRSRFNQWVF